MVTLEADGRIVFRIYAPRAREVLVVGAFEQWWEQRIPMTAGFGGVWHLRLHPGPGEFLFRYLIDRETWATDDAAHGTREVRGTHKSRVWCPIPGGLAA